MREQPDNHLVSYLSRATRVLVFTGAGISTGSGIKDYRGPQGVWKTRQPVYYQDFMEKESARFEYWDYKLEGWESFRDAQPNPVHLAIVDLERAGRLEMAVTQNVDGLHFRAGTSPHKLIEIHGSNLAVECQSCGRITDPEPHYEEFKATGNPPICHCAGYLKPATISFGQNLRDRDLRASAQAAQNADLVISLGSTLGVYPAAGIPLAAAERGVPYIIINQGETQHDALPQVSLRMEGDVVELFPPAVNAALAGGAGP